MNYLIFNLYYGKEAELAMVSDYIMRWFACPKIDTYSGTGHQYCMMALQ